MSTSLYASMEPQFRTVDGVRIRYADSGGSQEPVVTLTSPWPESGRHDRIVPRANTEFLDERAAASALDRVREDAGEDVGKILVAGWL